MIIRSLATIIVLAIALINPAVKAVDNQIIPTEPVIYSDGRPSPNWRLPALDNGVIFNYNAAPNGTDVKGARDAFIYQENGTYYMTYDGAGADYWTVNEATSTNLTDWTKLGKVLDKGPAGKPDSATVAYGTIYKTPTDSAYYMFYLGTQVKAGQPTNVPLPPYVSLRAKGPTPTGGWSKQSAIPIISLVNGSYREITASPGPIIKQGDHYYMYFSAAAEDNGKVYRGIGLAWTANLNSTTWSVGSGPIIQIYDQVENASLYHQAEDNTWYMFVNHVGVDTAGEETTDSIWVYWSNSPFDWDSNNKAVVLDGSVSSWSNDVIGVPSVVPQSDHLDLVYDGRATLDPDNILNNINRDIGLANISIPIRLP